MWQKSLLTEKTGVDALFSGCEVEVSGGKIVEENTTSTLLKNPEHPYTKKLLLASGLLQEQDMDQAMKPL